MYRSAFTHLVLKKEDFETIDAYYEWFFKLPIDNQTLSAQDSASLEFFVKGLKNAVIQNKIPKEYLPKLNKMIVAANGLKVQVRAFYNGKKFIAKEFRTFDLLWYLQYRLADNADQEAVLLGIMDENGLYDKNNSEDEKILKLLLIDNNIKPIQKWQNKEQIKNYPQIVELLQRRDKILKAINSHNKDFVSLLIDDYRLTINQIFSELSHDEANYGILELFLKHNEWLFLQLNKNKKNSKVDQFLTELYKDWLMFNDSSLVGKIPAQSKDGDRYMRLSWINRRLAIYRKILEIRGAILKQSGLNLSEYERELQAKNISFKKQKLAAFDKQSDTEDSQ